MTGTASLVGDEVSLVGDGIFYVLELRLISLDGDGNYSAQSYFKAY